MVLGPLLAWCAAAAAAEPTGSIRGVVYDKEFEAPLAAPQVTIVETGAKVTGTDQGTFVLGDVPPGRYTLVFSKDGYTRQVKAEVEAWLSGELVDMEEFIVQEIEFGGGTEEALLALRMEMPQLMDSVSADLLGRAGAGDASEGLRLVAGATVQEGKYAVVRGLPDRYVNSQMNYVRLPTADVDKRAVELDQFPSAVIESIQVSKTFTPDQQGDASGGAVNIILKGVPNQTILKADLKYGYNTQTSLSHKFLTYKGGGLDFWGRETPGPQPEGNWTGAVGVTRDRAPVDYEWSLAAGGRHVFGTGAKVGGFANFYYKRDNSFHDNGVDDSWWVEEPGAPMTPRYSQGKPDQGTFNTSLFDVTQGSQEVQWGGLGTLGLETENHRLNVTYMYTRVAEDTATLADDTRGKEYFYPGYDRYDQEHPGNLDPQAAPWLRNETLKYAERTTRTLQVAGRHTLPVPEFGIEGFYRFLPPQVDWTLAWSFAGLNEPDKRQFGTKWTPGKEYPPFPPFWPDPQIVPPAHLPLKPDANAFMGNLQRTWKEIAEDSDQWFVNVKFPFKQWTGDEGYLKMGVFRDEVRRTYDQESFSNFDEQGAGDEGEWEDFWSAMTSRPPPLTLTTTANSGSRPGTTCWTCP
jgi:hypothetical protein